MIFIKKKKNSTGFTMVELLVVIAIVGFLATMIVVSLIDARNKASDSVRLSDMANIRKALDMYFDENGHYPVGDYDACLAAEWDHGPCSADSNGFLSELQPFIPAGTPVDLSGGDGTGSYGYVYHLYDAGEYGCDAGKFFVLGIRDMLTVLSGGIYTQSPGWACPGRNWENDFEWVTGGYEGI